MPGWVSFSDGPRCASLDVSALRDIPEPPPLEEEPSSLPDSQQLERIETQMVGLRSLLLYSAGILTFLLAALLFRMRRT